MEISAEWSKVLAVGTTAPQQAITIKNGKLGEVHAFRYLGATIMRSTCLQICLGATIMRSTCLQIPRSYNHEKYMPSDTSELQSPKTAGRWSKSDTE